MDHTLFIAIIAGLGGMLGWGFSEFATKKSVDIVGTISSLVWAHIFGTAVLFALLFSTAATDHTAILFPKSLEEWLGLIFFGTLQTAVYYFAYKAFEEGVVSILSPIFASFAGIVALLSVMFFGESLGVAFVPALILIFSGTILINLDFKGLKAGRVRVKAVAGLKEIVIATILAAIWTLGWDRVSLNKDWIVYTAFMFLFMTLSAVLLAKLTHSNFLKIKPGAWKFLSMIAIGEVIAYLAITLGYSSTTHTSVVAVLSGAASTVTIILARIFLKEKMTIIQAIGSLIIIIGIIFLSVVK